MVDAGEEAEAFQERDALLAGQVARVFPSAEEVLEFLGVGGDPLPPDADEAVMGAEDLPDFGGSEGFAV